MSTPLPTEQQMQALAAALDTISAHDLAKHARVIMRTLTLPQGEPVPHGEPVDRIAALERRVAELERNQRTDTRGLGGGMDPAQVERVTFPPPAVYTSPPVTIHAPFHVEDLGFGQVAVHQHCFKESSLVPTLPNPTDIVKELP